MHTAAGERLHTLVILGAVGVGVEVARAAIAHILQKLHQEEGALNIHRAKAEVLIIAARRLVVQVDMEQLAHLPGLRHAVQKVQSSHLLVGNLGVDAHHIGLVERGDKGQGVAHGGEVDVAARLVGLRLQRELQVVALALGVQAEEVQRLAEALARLQRIFGGVGLHTLAAAPEHIGRGAALHAQVDGTHRLLERVGAHSGVVAGKGAILEGGVAEQVGGRHRHHHAGGAEGGLEVAHDLVALGGGCVDRHKIVVVEVHAVGAHLGEQVDELYWRARLAHRLAEGVAPQIANGPEAKGKLVSRRRCVAHRGNPFRRQAGHLSTDATDFLTIIM